ncbi:hypothetical protein PVAND_008373 [Polypedilum vanderplanki]|uniref:Dolichyl-diphosphooligosaccharide-protein glycosyltransferase subunit TMEM258 n=1 Tax=Polypedilum vanderplanki TaxID=319348 RepID=A0A9J6CA01_POLVA|nr:hypothetical protein PVAND_008373 [Polypedilum vanderplanki]
MDYVRYTSPVNPSIYPHLATILLIIGVSLSAWFFVLPKRQVVFKELCVSLIASVFLGFGVLFLFLSAGIYV